MLKKLLLAVCIVAATSSVSEAYVVGGFGYPAYGGYGWTYPAPGVRYYRPHQSLRLPLPLLPSPGDSEWWQVLLLGLLTVNNSVPCFRLVL